MRVYIGPYKRYVGVYPLINWTRKLGVSEETVDKWYDWICDRLEPILTWVNSRRRTVKVRIDNYDSWGVDSTLSHIIHPLLVQLKNTKHGSPFVDDEDVPEHLRSTAAPPKENEWDVDEYHHARWEWVLDEMIWAFDSISQEDRGNIDLELHEKETARRLTNSFRLFGKYYQCLWD